jgi:truncated hemoglobin YjbI/hemoglobin-like flavoprotein
MNTAAQIDSAPLFTAIADKLRAAQEVGIGASAKRIRERIDAFAPAFFASLYERAPHARRMFGSGDVERRKLGAMLSLLGNPRRPEHVQPMLARLGERHAGYGVAESDYAPLAEAFLEAVRAVDEDCDEAGIASWRDLLAQVSAILQEAQTAAIPPSEAPSAEAIEASSNGPTLYEEIGGTDVVERVHRRFYAALSTDPWLGGFFAGKNLESLIMKQTRFMVAAFGGPDEYIWESPAVAHMHMMVTDKQADIREVMLRNAIRAEGLSQDIEDRWLAHDQAFRPAIVKQSVDECVTPTPGQAPVVVPKPIVYRAPKLTERG